METSVPLDTCFPKNEKRVCIELLTLWNNLQSGNFGISLRLRTTLNTG
jgi:hypothetical protein